MAVGDPVSGGRHRLRHSYADLGTSGITGHSGSLDAAPVCGSHVLRGGLYAADYSPKKCGPHRGISALKSGVRLFRAGRLDDSSSEPEHQRIVRLCAHVRSYYSGTAAGEEARSIAISSL